MNVIAHKVFPDARTPVALVAGRERRLNPNTKLSVPLRVGRLGTVLPGIEPATRNLKRATERCDRDSGLLRLDEREPYTFSLAKKAIAFFKMSPPCALPVLIAKPELFRSATGQPPGTCPIVRSAWACFNPLPSADGQIQTRARPDGLPPGGRGDGTGRNSSVNTRPSGPTVLFMPASYAFRKMSTKAGQDHLPFQ